MSREPITGPSVWTADDLQRDPSWIYTLDASHLQELGRDRPLSGPVTTLLDRISDELEHGRGVARLRGLPIDRYSEDELRRIFWTIGEHMGTPLFQNRTCEIMGEVRDETHDAAPSFQASNPGKVQSSRARARSTGPLRFHTDRCDVIALFCARNGIAGGVSKLASIPTIYNEILCRRPTCSTSCSPTTGTPAQPTKTAPLRNRSSRCPSSACATARSPAILSHLCRTGAGIRLCPAVASTQNEALDLLAEVAEETCLHAPFEPGDIQFLNNHVVYHGRTAYQDDAERGQSRLLLRLWLAVPNSRPLPEGFDVLWGAIHRRGAGGVVQADGRRSLA